MKKSDLKIGMVVELRDRTKALVFGTENNYILYGLNGYLELKDLKEDLKCIYYFKDSHLDIVKVFTVNKNIKGTIYDMVRESFKEENLQLVWSRDN